jgi:membrane protein implicated in regulation of membrane protease activity
MTFLMIAVVVVTVAGVVLLGAMFLTPDTRVAMIGLAALMTAEVMAMVHATLRS